MNKDYYNYIIIGLVGVILVVVGILLLGGSSDNNKNTLVFKLNGDEKVFHTLGEPYNDPGVTLTDKGVDKKELAIVENKVNINKEGTYTITYKYSNQTLTRYVTIRKGDSFTLLGDEEIYLLINGEYNDPKVSITYEGVDASSQVTVNDNIDVTTPGDYEITYTFDKLNKSLTRKVHVSEFNDYFKITYDNKESTSVNLNISIDKTKVSKYTLPNNEEKNDNSTYSVTANGTYKFTIYDKYNNHLDKNITISNINTVTPTPTATPIQLTASCKAEAKDNKTIVTVTASKKIIKYVYNGIESTNNTHTFNEIVKDNKVVIYDSDNQSKEITCTTNIVDDSKLEIHFINAGGYYDDAILIRTNKATIFMDGGRGKEAVVKYLNALNVKTIDYVIGSHTEYDHIDAQGEVIKQFDVKHALYPNSISSCGCRCDNTDVRNVNSALRSKNMKDEVQSIPSKLEIGDLTLYFIAPSKLGCNKNNNSFVFIMQFKNNKFMFTGDQDSAFNDINQLTTHAKTLGLNDISVDVMKYPHHGNETLGDKLIDTINPKYFIVPNVNAARYPSQTFRDKMSKKGIKVYRQSDSKTGNILITSDGTNITFTMDVEAKNYAR